MSCTTWTPRAVKSEARDWAASVWRMVESQHIASTMKLVDDAAEQDVLEALLEGSKPPQPKATQGLDYLLATPFRYDPKRGGSRFRAEADPGVYYGAQSVRTAAAELGYWRWRFLRDAVDVRHLEPVAHSAFCADVDALAIDLREPPFAEDRPVWMHPLDYGPTQRFARVARDADVGAIVYASVRDPGSAWCAAVLTPAAFARPQPRPGMQTWWLAVKAGEVVWRRNNAAMIFSATDWE